jgi:hypothetical protein
MSLKDDNITEFPGILKSFLHLNVLNMDENDLKFVSDKSASAATHISDLSRVYLQTHEMLLVA